MSVNSVRIIRVIDESSRSVQHQVRLYLADGRKVRFANCHERRQAVALRQLVRDFLADGFAPLERDGSVILVATATRA